MKRQEFLNDFIETDPDYQKHLVGLVARYLTENDTGVAAAVRCASSAAPLGPKALSVVSHLEETAVRPLVHALGNGHALDSWMLIELAKSLDATQNAVAARLRAALQDTRTVQSPGDEVVEEREPPFRVRDEAYLALRRIEGSDSTLHYTLELRHFLNLPDSEKDAEIQHYLETRSFRRMVPGADDEE